MKSFLSNLIDNESQPIESSYRPVPDFDGIDRHNVFIISAELFRDLISVPCLFYFHGKGRFEIILALLYSSKFVTAYKLTCVTEQTDAALNKQLFADGIFDPDVTGYVHISIFIRHLNPYFIRPMRRRLKTGTEII